MFLILFASLASYSVFAENPPHQVMVQGQCTLQVVPDRARVSFTAENQSKKQDEAFKKTTQEINALKAKIEALKLKGVVLKTTQYQVYPVREYENEKFVDKGTRVSMTLEVSAQEVNRLGESLLLASQVGLKNIGSLESYLSDELEKETYLKCLDIASDDAKSKAQTVAKKLGFRLGSVQQVNEMQSNLDTPSPQPYRGGMMKSMSAATAESTQVEAGQTKFTTTLQVAFGIK